jgi:hypothetical protein
MALSAWGMVVLYQHRGFRHSNRYLPRIVSQNLSVRDTEALVKLSGKSKTETSGQDKGIVSI